MPHKSILLSRQRRVSLPALWHGLWLTTSYFLLFTLTYAQTWNDVGGGMGGFGSNVGALIVYNNELYAGGGFNTAGGIYTTGLARWNGIKWDSAGTNDTAKGVNCFAVYNNELYFGGFFDPPAPGTGDVFKLGKWDGSQWSKVSGGVTASLTQSIYTMAAYKGELYIGGNITTIDGISINRIARWDGNNWKNVGGGVTGGFGEVRAMAVFNNELYVGGDFTFAGGVPANYIARWNGTQWDSVGTGVDGAVISMANDTINNVLYVGGPFFNAGGVPVNFIAKWDSMSWSNIGNGVITSGLTTIAMYNNELYVGGIDASDTILSRWDGSNWYPVLGPNSTITSLAVYNDELYVGGYFDKVNTTTVNYIARYNASVGIDDINKKKIEYLSDNIPNPFKNTTTIPYYVPQGSEGVIKVYDIIGELVKEIEVSSNSRQVEISLEGFAEGAYLYSIEIDGVFMQSRKMVVAE